MRSRAPLLIRRQRRRLAFTLVELLVVMGVVLVLMTLAVAFVPRAQEQQRVSRGASQVQGWLAIAKQWALRDRAPRGLRLTPNAGNGNWVTTMQYIEQPDDFLGPSGSFVQVALATPSKVVGSGVDFWGGFAGGAGNSKFWPVQPNDYIEFGSSNSKSAHLHRIQNVDPNNGTILYTFPQDPCTSSNPINNEKSFRIVRAARLRAGEAPLQLPADVAIDVSTNTTYTSTLPASVNASGSIDILFTPSGTVIANGSLGNDVRLWLIDTTLNSGSALTYDGQQLIVNVSIRTGLISVQPVNLDVSGNRYSSPYLYTQDGKISGL